MVLNYASYSRQHIDRLVAKARLRCQKWQENARKERSLKHHLRYWNRLDWETRIILNAVELGRNLYWPNGCPVALIEQWTGVSKVENQRWFNHALTIKSRTNVRRNQRNHLFSARTPQNPPTTSQTVRFSSLEAAELTRFYSRMHLWLPANRQSRRRATPRRCPTKIRTSADLTSTVSLLAHGTSSVNYHSSYHLGSCFSRLLALSPPPSYVPPSQRSPRR